MNTNIKNETTNNMKNLPYTEPNTNEGSNFVFFKKEFLDSVIKQAEDTEAAPVLDVYEADKNLRKRAIAANMDLTKSYRLSTYFEVWRHEHRKGKNDLVYKNFVENCNDEKVVKALEKLYKLWIAYKTAEEGKDEKKFNALKNYIAKTFVNPGQRIDGTWHPDGKPVLCNRNKFFEKLEKWHSNHTDRGICWYINCYGFTQLAD